MNLDEHQSKEILKQYGVPVISEIVVRTEAEALEAAHHYGFPVVIKGFGATLLHKSERGLVRLNLMDEAAVTAVFHDMAAEAGDELEGVLVQPQLKGKRELIAGLIRDRQFGPAVMVGLGGIFTEALSDVAFRIAPVTEEDVREMLAELKANVLFDAFRGDAAVNTDKLVQTLLGLSRIGIECPDIVEIDINPLILTSEGDVCAVDALVVKGESTPVHLLTTPVDPMQLRKIFYPSSIAFVGASSEYDKWGNWLPANAITGGYQGKIYLVNSRGGEIFGRTVYRSVEEIPGPVELGIVTIPAAFVHELIPQFVTKNIRQMLLISSGFGETGEAGRQLEQELIQAAEKAGILVLGPNTMGICNPHIDFYVTGHFVRPKAGGTSIIAQSGNLGAQLLEFAVKENIGIRAFCGSGNEAMVTIEDYLAAFENDAETRSIMMYVESVRDGRRFLELARRISRKKPLVMLRGGRSSAGSLAAASHTGALSSDSKIFEAASRQAGIVTVKHSMDLLDLAAAFSSLPLPKGNRVAIMTGGGGWGVVTTDLCADYNIEVPELPDFLVKQIDKLLPHYWSRANPLDIVGVAAFDIPITILEFLMKWEGCDGVINLSMLGRENALCQHVQMAAQLDPNCPRDLVDRKRTAMRKFEEDFVTRSIQLMEKYRKPIYGVSYIKSPRDKTIYEVAGHEYKGLFLETPERAVKVLAKMIEYQQFCARHWRKD